MWNSHLSIDVCQHLLVAMFAGGAIGLERTWNGRAAGFRTHILVSVTSALLMLVTLYQGQWFGHSGTGGVNTDPTRMAQGIMTGIGFLGAGVIMKEGLAVRGLTTAASIWISAALGILAGIGLYQVVLAGVVLALVALAAFRWVEQVFPTRRFTQLNVVYRMDPTAPLGVTASERNLRQAFKTVGMDLNHIDCELDLPSQERSYSLSLVSGRNRPDMDQIHQVLQQCGSIIRLSTSTA